MNRVIKYTSILAAVALLGVSQASAMTEGWSAINGRYLSLANTTTPVVPGSYIAIGIVTNTTYTLSLAGVSATAIANSMLLFDTSTVGTGAGNTEGAFSVTSAKPGAGYFSAQIYLLAINTASLGTASQVGLFTDTAWVFPASDAAGANSLDLANAGITALIGSLHAGTINDANLGGIVNAASLATIPEPSTIALIGFGLLGLIAIRRRK